MIHALPSSLPPPHRTKKYALVAGCRINHKNGITVGTRIIFQSPIYFLLLQIVISSYSHVHHLCLLSLSPPHVLSIYFQHNSAHSLN